MSQKIQLTLLTFILGLDYKSDFLNATFDYSILRCSHFTGTVNGKKIVIRGCDLINDTFKCMAAGIVWHDRGHAYSAFISLDNKIAYDANVCFCSEDNCNGLSKDDEVTTTPIRSTKKTHNSASGCQFNSYSLLVAEIVYLMYKCVS